MELVGGREKTKMVVTQLNAVGPRKVGKIDINVIPWVLGVTLYKCSNCLVSKREIFLLIFFVFVDLIGHP